MGRVVIVWAAVVVAVGALLALSAAAQEPDGIRWETDLAAAHAVAGETGRPLMVVFR